MPLTARQRKVDTAIINGFGFGGQNAVAVFRRFEEAFGALDCRTLTGLDFNEEHPQEELDRVHGDVCVALVRFVAGATLAELAAVGTKGA